MCAAENAQFVTRCSLSPFCFSEVANSDDDNDLDCKRSSNVHTKLISGTDAVSGCRYPRYAA